MLLVNCMWLIPSVLRDVIMTKDGLNPILFCCCLFSCIFLFVILMKFTYLVYATGDAINNELMAQDTVLIN